MCRVKPAPAAKQVVMIGATSTSDIQGAKKILWSLKDDSL